MSGSPQPSTSSWNVPRASSSRANRVDSNSSNSNSSSRKRTLRSRDNSVGDHQASSSGIGDLRRALGEEDNLLEEVLGLCDSASSSVPVAANKLSDSVTGLVRACVAESIRDALGGHKRRLDEFKEKLEDLERGQAAAKREWEERYRNLEKLLGDLLDRRDDPASANDAMTEEVQLKLALSVPWRDYDAVQRVLNDDELIAKANRYAEIAVDSANGGYAANFVDAFFEKNFAHRCWLPNLAPGSRPLNPGRHFFLGEDVWELPISIQGVFLSSVKRLRERQRIGEARRGQTLDDLKSVFRANRRARKALLLPRLRARAVDGNDSLRKYFDLLYKDSCASLKVLFDAVPPNLEDPREVSDFCRKYREEVDLRDREARHAVRKQMTTKRRRTEDRMLKREAEEDEPQSPRGTRRVKMSSAWWMADSQDEENDDRESQFMRRRIKCEPDLSESE